jgi:hypothetical protein
VGRGEVEWSWVGLVERSGKAQGKLAAQTMNCGQAVDCEENRRTWRRIVLKLRTEVRDRGFEKATKFGFSLRYLGLRVAPTGLGVNARRNDFW